MYIYVYIYLYTCIHRPSAISPIESPDSLGGYPGPGPRTWYISGWASCHLPHSVASVLSLRGGVSSASVLIVYLMFAPPATATPPRLPPCPPRPAGLLATCPRAPCHMPLFLCVSKTNPWRQSHTKHINALRKKGFLWFLVVLNLL